MNIDFLTLVSYMANQPLSYLGLKEHWLLSDNVGVNQQSEILLASKDDLIENATPFKSCIQYCLEFPQVMYEASFKQ